MKTAGGTLRRILARQYPPDAVLTITGTHHGVPALAERIAPSGLANARAVQGHIPFGVHELLPGPATYITLLREPVARIRSLYRYRVEQGRRELFRDDRPLSLEQYIRDVRPKELDNAQTRRLSGMDPDFGQCSWDMLQSAKRNLRDHFAVAGPTEMFDHVLVLLQRILGWKHILYFRINVTKEPPERVPLSAELRDLIVKYNELDLELYRHASHAFEESVRSRGSDFEEDVQTFKRVNDRYARFEVYAGKARERSSMPDGSGPGELPSYEQQLLQSVFEEHPQLLARQFELNVEVQRLRQGEALLQKALKRSRQSEARLDRRVRDLQVREAALAEKAASLKAKLAAVRGRAGRKSGPAGSAEAKRLDPS